MRTLIDAGVTMCFTNPRTSEMHLVAARTARQRYEPFWHCSKA